jgi:hypothetical protein
MPHGQPSERTEAHFAIIFVGGLRFADPPGGFTIHPSAKHQEEIPQ